MPARAGRALWGYGEVRSTLKPVTLGEGRTSVQDERKTSRGTRRLDNLPTPSSVQNQQTALQSEAKAEAGYRFYALYDKVSREDILTHAYAQCCSHKGYSW
jgi:hypothetical protein